MTAKGLGETLIAVIVIGIQTLFLASAIGVVREHCLASQPANLRDVESSWTYVVWPPLVFSAIDPPGRCVRNTIGREVLGKAGVWPLGTPAEQVEAHLGEQAEREGSEDLLTLLEPGGGSAEDEKRLLLNQFAALSRQLGYPEPVRRCVMKAVRRLPAESLYDEGSGEVDNERVAAEMEKAWQHCLPTGQPTISPDASDRAVESNRQLITTAVSQNMQKAGANAEQITCAEEAIAEINREALIEMSADPDGFAAHVESLVRTCTQR